MSIRQLRREIKGEFFDYQVLTNFLSDLKQPRNKIGRLMKNGEIVRIKKGLYVFGEAWRNSPISLETAANLIYGPSCISFEYALYRYGLIAERAPLITSLAIGRCKEFETPIGTFHYRAIQKHKFGVGIEYRDLGEEGGYFIATREKALADLVSTIKRSLSTEELRFFLLDEMRIDENFLVSFNRQLMESIATAYHNHNIFKILQL